MKKQLFILVSMTLIFTSCQEIKQESAEFVKKADEAFTMLNSKSNSTRIDDSSKTTIKSIHDNTLNKRNHE